MRQLIIAALLVLLVQTLGIPPCFAAQAPNPSANMILAGMIKMGTKVYFLGNHSGLNGWFLIKDGQVQFVYTTPDNKGLIEGALFDQDGENVTVAQVNALTRENKEVGDLFKTITQQASSALGPAGTSALTPPVGATSGSGAPPALPVLSLSPGERLMKDLSDASSVVVGKQGTPELLMVMDPHCPHCQATWKVLRDKVVAGALHIRLIPIGLPDTDNERAAAVLLTASNPFQTWDGYVGGDRSQLVGTPSPAATAAVKANHALIDRWNITATPYLVYRSRDGKVKILSGEPEAVSSVFADMGI